MVRAESPRRDALILLAAGRSRRFAAGDKLLHPWRGAPLLAQTLRALASAPAVARVAVTGAGDEARRAMLAPAGYQCVENPDPARGMGSSLACAVAALPPAIDGVFVCLADMPLLPPTVFAQLAAALEATPGISVVCPRHAGQRGHPVLFSASHLPALAALDGDEGARAVLAAAGSALLLLDIDDPGVLRDFDTVEAFAEQS